MAWNDERPGKAIGEGVTSLIMEAPALKGSRRELSLVSYGRVGIPEEGPGGHW